MDVGKKQLTISTLMLMCKAEDMTDLVSGKPVLHGGKVGMPLFPAQATLVAVRTIVPLF